MGGIEEPGVKQVLTSIMGQGAKRLARGEQIYRPAPPASRGRRVVAGERSDLDMKREMPMPLRPDSAFVLLEMDAINKAAYWDYQRERVDVKVEKSLMLQCVMIVRPPQTSSTSPRFRVDPHCPEL